MHVLVAGAGWLGLAIVEAFRARGARVTAVRRSAERLLAVERLGASPLPLDLSDPAAAERLPRDVDVFVACQSAREDSAKAYRAAYVDVNRTLLEAAARRPGSVVVYTSSTGVFGQRDGGAVDEASEPSPASESAEVLVEAERLVLGAVKRGVDARVVRLSGLYGPGRYGVVERVRTGALRLGPGDQAWMNFCHLEDAVAFVLATLDRGAAGAVYHGSDADPARRRDVVRWIAERLGIEPASSAGETRGPDRRILSDRTRRELGVQLRYPSFRDGLVGVVGPGG